MKRGFVLVASQFNAKYVQGLVNHCTDELRILSPASNVTLHLVPGAFEIPIVVPARWPCRKMRTRSLRSA